MKSLMSIRIFLKFTDGLHEYSIDGTLEITVVSVFDIHNLEVAFT